MQWPPEPLNVLLDGKLFGVSMESLRAVTVIGGGHTGLFTLGLNYSNIDID